MADLLPVDEAILRLLDESGIRLTPNNIAVNAGYNSDYVSKRCKRLLDHGYVDVSTGGGDPFYTITDAGRERLAELEAEEDGDS